MAQEALESAGRWIYPSRKEECSRRHSLEGYEGLLTGECRESAQALLAVETRKEGFLPSFTPPTGEVHPVKNYTQFLFAHTIPRTVIKSSG